MFKKVIIYNFYFYFFLLHYISKMLFVKAIHIVFLHLNKQIKK